MKFMLSQSPAQVPVKYVSVQCREGGGSAIAVGTLRYVHAHSMYMHTLCTVCQVYTYLAV